MYSELKIQFKVIELNTIAIPPPLGFVISWELLLLGISFRFLDKKGMINFKDKYVIEKLHIGKKRINKIITK